MGLPMGPVMGTYVPMGIEELFFGPAPVSCQITMTPTTPGSPGFGHCFRGSLRVQPMGSPLASARPPLLVPKSH